MTKPTIAAAVLLASTAAASCGGSTTRTAGDATDGVDAGDVRDDGQADIPIDEPRDSGTDEEAGDVPEDQWQEPDSEIEHHGECTSSTDCDGRECVRVPDVPGGYRVCADPPRAEAEECTSSDFDECCTSEDCTGGEDGGCYYTEDPGCYGPVMPPYNRCYYTQCHADMDCGEGMICIREGVLGLLRNTCVLHSCRSQLDCDEMPGGYCKPFFDPCCSPRLSAFACVDPSVCETDGDCPEGQSCIPDASTGWAYCDMVVCPL